MNTQLSHFFASRSSRTLPAIIAGALIVFLINLIHILPLAGLVFGISGAIYFTRPEHARTAVWLGAVVAFLGFLLSNWTTPESIPAVHNFSQVLLVISGLLLGVLASAILGAILGFLAFKLIQVLKRGEGMG